MKFNDQVEGFAKVQNRRARNVRRVVNAVRKGVDFGKPKAAKKSFKSEGLRF